MKHLQTMPNQGEFVLTKANLIQDVFQGDVASVRSLLNDKHVNVNVNRVTEGGWTALTAACFEGYDDIAELLLDHGADTEIKVCCRNGTALMMACQNDHVSTVELLLKFGANAYEIGTIGWCPLHWACAQGYTSIVTMLMERGVNPNGFFKVSKAVPLHIACRNGNIKCVHELLLYGANVNILDGEGKTPIDLAKKRRYKKIVSLLKKAKKSTLSGIRTRTENCTVSTISTKCLKHYQLVEASSDGNIDDVRVLLHDREVDVNGAENFNGRRTALIAASSEGHVNIVELLLEYGANTEAQCLDSNHTALMLACQGDHISTVEVLLGHGAIIDNYNNVSCSPLYESCRLGHEDVTILLLEAGANPNGTCRKGRYLPLLRACEQGYSKVVQQLLHHGADIDVKDNNDKTPFDLALSQGHHSIVALLEKCKEEIEKGRNQFAIVYHQSRIQIQLIEAARQGRFEDIKNIFYQNDVNTNWIAANGWTALASASFEWS